MLAIVQRDGAQCSRRARQVIGRTLEEIEALAAEATPGPWALNECSGGADLMLLGGPSRKYVASIRIHQVPRHMGEWEERKRTKTAELLEALPHLLAIAQGQREALHAIWPFVEEDDGGLATPEYQAAINQVRSILGIGTKK